MNVFQHKLGSLVEMPWPGASVTIADVLNSMKSFPTTEEINEINTELTYLYNKLLLQKLES